MDDLENIFKYIIIQRYEKNPVKENNLSYHNWNHTHGVYLRALEIEGVLLDTAFVVRQLPAVKTVGL